MGNTVMAYPTLQLDIVGGTYDGNTTIIDGTSGSFDLVALLNSSSYSGTYHITAAIVPSDTTYSGPNFPLLNSVTGVSGGLGGITTTTGTSRPTDLPWHGPFPTFYWDYEFEFDGNVTIAPYNVADDPGDPNTLGSGFYAAYFNFDVSSLLAEEGVDAVHFDLYTYSNLTGGQKIEFAPFSKDASAVPEPATLLLLGGGLVGLAGFGRKRFKK